MGPSSAAEVYRDGDVALTTSTVTVATLSNLPAGSYVILAKTIIVQTASSGGAGSANDFTRCTLNGEPNTNVPTDDFATTEVGRANSYEVGRATLQAEVTLNLGATTSVALKCQRMHTGTPPTVVARETKIIAINVGSTTRTAVSG